MKFGNAKGKVPKAKGKGGQQEMLPSRHALSQLSNPMQQTMNNYAKLTPSGAGAPSSYPAITAEGEEGVSVMP